MTPTQNLCFIYLEQHRYASMSGSHDRTWRDPNARQKRQKLSFQFMRSHISSRIGNRNAGIVANPSQFVTISGKRNGMYPSTSVDTVRELGQHIGKGHLGTPRSRGRLRFDILDVSRENPNLESRRSCS